MADGCNPKGDVDSFLPRVVWKIQLWKLHIGVDANTNAMPTLASHAFLKSVHLAKNWRATCYRPCCCVLPAVECKRRCHTTVFHPNCPRPLSCWKEVEEPEAMAKTETQNKFPSHLSQRSSKRETEQVSAGTKDPFIEKPGVLNRALGAVWEMFFSTGSAQ